MIPVATQLTLNGLVLGALYALAAVGLSLIFGILGVVNLSHGSQLALASFIAYSLYLSTQNIAVTAACAILIVSLLGVLMERVGIYPFRASEMRVLVITFGMGKVLEQAIYLTWGPTYITSPIYVPGLLDFLGVTITLYRVILLVLSAALILALWVFILKSKLGRAIRAVAQDEEAAVILGVDIKRIRMLTFALASALAAIGGIFLSSIYMFHPASGWEYLLIALSITIVGGLGDVRGAIIASFILGITESFIGYFVSPVWRTTVYFALIVIILVTKPSGLSGLLRGRS